MARLIASLILLSTLEEVVRKVCFSDDPERTFTATKGQEILRSLKNGKMVTFRR